MEIIFCDYRKSKCRPRGEVSAYLYTNKKNHEWEVKEIYEFAFSKGINW